MRAIGFSLYIVFDYLLSSAVSLVALHYMIGLIPTLGTEILLAVYIITIIYFILKRGLKVEGEWMIFLIYLPFTIILGQPDPVFHSWERLALFAAMFLVCSPVAQSNAARDFRSRCLTIILLFSILFSIGSFFAYFVGINLFSTEGQYDDFIENAGWFSGLTRQSMMLAPISGISVIYLSHHFLITKNPLYLALVIPCAGSLLFAASRSALGATIIGVVVAFYLTTRNNKKLFKRVIIAVLLLAITFPIWESSTSAVQQKQEGHSGEKELFDSRSGKIEARWDEFASSPLWGVGFSAIDAHGKDPFNEKTGTIEPGSSWMCILSMTGFVGLFMFIRLSIHTVKNVKKRNGTEACWLIGVLAFFFIHMLVEGYVYAAGNPVAFMLWQCLGNSYDKKYYVR